MIELDINLVRQHLKADAEDIEEALIEQYIASAVLICESYCNRKFYEDMDTLVADRTEALADMATAKEARDAELEDTDDCDVQNIIINTWISARAACLARTNGLVVDDTIKAAVLMTIGRLYSVRQDVVTGQGASAAQVPEGARRILEPYLWVGDLGGAS